MKWFATVIMVITTTMVISVYAEPMPETDGCTGREEGIWDYEGIITDEMMEEWEGGYDTEKPTDLYGNEIEWEIQGDGNEEEAGYETSADMMEAPTYSAKEQEEILENFQIADGAEAGGTEAVETGWLCINGNPGEGWPGYNITVALYNDSHKRVEVTLYSQEDFQVKRELPAGIYKVYRAYVPGDENRSSYPLVVSESSIEIEPHKAAKLTVWKALDISEDKEITKPEEQEGTESEQLPVRASTDRKAAVGIGIGLLFLAAGAMVYRRKRNYHRYQ